MLLDQSCRSLSRSLARYLAASVAEDLKPPQRRRFVDPGVMARCGRGRIGEAANPGPRRGRTRPEVDLEEVTLVRPATVAIQSKVRASFLDWLHNELSQETWESICRSPRLSNFPAQLWQLALQQWTSHAPVLTPRSFLSTTISCRTSSDTACMGVITSVGSSATGFP